MQSLTVCVNSLNEASSLYPSVELREWEGREGGSGREGGTEAGREGGREEEYQIHRCNSYPCVVRAATLGYGATHAFSVKTGFVV